MLGKQLVAIAAAVALAVTHVSAAEHGRKLSKTQHQKDDSDIDIEIVGSLNVTESSETTETTDEEVVEFCLPGWTEVSVEGVEDIYCAQGQICVDQIKDGACPTAQQGLPYGAYCDIVKTGVYGCKPKTKDMVEEEGDAPLCSGEGESPMSVEGVEGVFCVTGQACVADIADGACPGPQEGLPYGATCGKVKTGVYGCQPKTKDNGDDDEEEETTEEDDSDDSSDDVCGDGESPMSVEGVEGVFCVTGQACVADIMGSCPEAQDGLEFGAYCGKVKTGVLGCKPATKEMHDSGNYGDEDDEDDSNDSDDTEETVVEVDDKDDDSDDNSDESSPALCTGPGESPMSVEGVEGVFCVTGQACVADIANGACPGPQEGLPYGAKCGKVKTGVYGCQPKTEADEEPEEEPADDDCSGEGKSPMSVEGVEGVFCVTGQACVADIMGACPGPQAGLPNGAECGKVQSGVLGCKPISKRRHHHKISVSVKHHKDHNVCNGNGQSPMSVEGVEGVFCVTGQACVADIANGACPGAQAGLPYGAYCDKVKTGVYGCKPKTKDMVEESAPAPSCNGANQSPMSVEGVEGIFCVTGQACVADIMGACPGPQAGLPHGAECGKVKTGVLGCKPISKRHRLKGHSIKVVKAHAKKAHQH